ncbi:MAG: hypothetical protein GX483_00945 [Actinomycetaceae bacterium]|nr:hypothetical protein [Actinomycetaceae bacterium]
MKRRLILSFSTLVLASVVLGACSDNTDINADVIWEIPLELSAHTYSATHALSIAETEGYAVVVTPSEQGVQVRGFDTASGEEVYGRELLGSVACANAGEAVVCLPVSANSGIAPFAIDPASGDDHDYSQLLSSLGVHNDQLIVQRQSMDGFNLVALDPGTAYDRLDTGGDIIAVLDDSGTLHIADEDVYEALREQGVLTLTSMWADGLNIPGSVALQDGYLVHVMAADGLTTTVSIYDESGVQTGDWTFSASLHFSVNSQWTVTDVTGYLDKAAELAVNADHVAIFQDGEVVGLNRVLSDSVAPAYAWVTGFDTNDGVELRFTEVEPSSLVLWVMEYPYVGVNGVGDDGVVTRTFDITSGEVLVDGAKCQWITEPSHAIATYCFDGKNLSRIDWP